MIECCPVCEISGIYARDSKFPKYRCENGHTFPEPKERPKRQKARHTDEELLEGIRDLAEKVGRHPPRGPDMDDVGDYWRKSYQRRFGSWNEAVKRAGFTPNEDPTDSWNEEPRICILCETGTKELDFHHWRYGERKKGCYLCRSCHDAVHEGKGSTQNPDWLKHAIENLVNRHRRQHGSVDTEEILNRYKLPDVEPLVEMAITSS